MKRYLCAVFFCLLLRLALPARSYFDDNLYSFRLGNGLSVFVLPDGSDALVRAELVVRAGYLDQRQGTAGFARLCFELFFSDADGTYALERNGVAHAAECTDTAAFYTLVFPPQVTALALSFLAGRAFSPDYADSELLSAVAQAGAQDADGVHDVTRFINSEVAARVFNAGRWQQPSEPVPASFATMSAAAIRAELHRFASALYVSENCALFVSGGVDRMEIEAAVQDAFGKFPSSAGGVPPRGTSRPADGGGGRKPCVLVSPGFSPDLNQIVLHYPAAHDGEDAAVRIAASLLGGDGDGLLSDLAGKADTGILSAGYAAASVARHGVRESLVVQALTDSAGDAAAQLGAIASGVEGALSLAAEGRAFARHAEGILARIGRSRDAAGYMRRLAEFFASDAMGLAAPAGVPAEEAAGLVLSLAESGPYAFVLMNSAVFERQKASFPEEAFDVVFHGAQAELLAADGRPDGGADSEEKSVFPGEAAGTEGTADRALEFASRYSASISMGRLSNGIGFCHVLAPERTTACIRVEIDGGERSSFRGVAALETLAVRCLAAGIVRVAEEFHAAGLVSSVPEVSCSTGLESSAITLVCDADDLAACLQLVSATIIFGEISPAAADEALHAVRREHRISSGDASFQLFCSAMQAFYAGTDYEGLFAPDGEPMQDVDYGTISAAYSAFLDASRYTLVVSSPFPSGQGLASAQRFFGALAAFPADSALSGGYAASRPKVLPKIPGGTTFVRLNRVFATDVPAHLAGERPARLVPTTEFNDPVHFYCAAPGDSADIPLYNALLYELAFRLERRLASGVQVRAATASMPFGGLQVAQVSAGTDVVAVLKEEADALRAGLSDGDALREIKAKWVSASLSALSGGSGAVRLAAEGLASCGNPGRFAEEYVAVSRAAPEDFARVMDFVCGTELAVVCSESRR